MIDCGGDCNVTQVYDLSDGGPERGLSENKDKPGVRMIVCGGDGSVCWVHGILDKLCFGEEYPPVGVLPLGTGNDLARVLGWGGGYENESLSKIVSNLEKAAVVRMDRWKVQCLPTTPDDLDQAKRLVRCCESDLIFQGKK